jgi:hypothetical protein
LGGRAARQLRSCCCLARSAQFASAGGRAARFAVSLRAWHLRPPAPAGALRAPACSVDTRAASSFRLTTRAHAAGTSALSAPTFHTRCAASCACRRAREARARRHASGTALAGNSQDNWTRVKCHAAPHHRVWIPGQLPRIPAGVVVIRAPRGCVGGRGRGRGRKGHTLGRSGSSGSQCCGCSAARGPRHGARVGHVGPRAEARRGACCVAARAEAGHAESGPTAYSVSAREERPRCDRAGRARARSRLMRAGSGAKQ